MNPAEFRARGLARYGNGWQSKLARDLDVNPRTVRRWAAGDVSVPLNVQMHLGGNPPIARDYPDEWLVASDPNEEREYVIHLAPPRFVGLIDDPDTPGDGVVLALRDEAVSSITWIDPPPPDLLALLRSLQRAIDRYDE